MGRPLAPDSVKRVPLARRAGTRRECGLNVPWNNPETDIARKCADSPELFFIAELGVELVGSCMAGYDGHRGWIYFLAVKPAEQRKGIAAKLVTRAEQALIQLGAPSSN